MDTPFSPILQEARQRLQQSLTDPSYEERGRCFGAFMGAVERLGRAMAKDGPPPEVTAFVADTAPLLARAEVPLNLWHGGLSDRLYYSDAEEDYQRSCIDRSALAFLTELYRGTVAEELLSEVELGDIDERLRVLVERHGGERPPGIPDSHWWW